MTEDENWECIDCIVMGCSKYGEIVAPYEKKLAIAVEALGWYANKVTWSITMPEQPMGQVFWVGGAYDDRGARARAALEKITKERV